MFLATLGHCMAVLAEVEAEGAPPKPAETTERVSKVVASGSLGQPMRKRTGFGCTPEVHGFPLTGGTRHPFLLLASSAVQETLSAGQLIDMAAEFNMQPRAACSDVVQKALEAHGKLKPQAPQAEMVIAQACLLPPKEVKEDAKKAVAPPAKKAKVVGGGSFRLRHIMLKVQDAAGKEPPTKAAAAASAKTAKPARPRAEAEVMLRDALKELRQDLADKGKTPKSATDLVIFQGKKFSELCKKMSDCSTAQKGGAMCGDLGWLSMDELGKLGGNLREKVEPLRAGQWSDICVSDRGMHLVQRVA